MKKTIICLTAVLLTCAAPSLYAAVKIYSGCQVTMNNNSQLDVKGNWENNSASFVQNSGKVIFSGAESTNSTVLHTGSFKDVTVNKTGSGTLALGGNLNVNGVLTMQSGKVATNTYILNLGTTGAITGEANGRYVIGKLSASASVGTGSSIFGGIGAAISSGSDNLGTVTAVRTAGSDGIVNIDGTQGIARKWQLTGGTPSAGRTLTFNWLSDDNNGNDGLSSLKAWHSADNTTWHGIAEGLNGSGQTVSVPTTTLGYFTLSSQSPINLPSTISFNEDNQKTINLATGLKGTGKYAGYLDDCSIYFNDGKKNQLLKKGDSERAYNLSVSGATNIGVTFNGMNATLTPAANWNGTNNLTFTLTEAGKSSENLIRQKMTSKATLQVNPAKAVESFYDITAVTVNPVNDAPAVLSNFPASLNFGTNQQFVKFSVKINDVDNPFNTLAFKWFVKKGTAAEVEQADYDSVFTASFNTAVYTVRSQVSDGLLTTNTTWIVDAAPSAIGRELIPTVTEIQQNYPNPFNPQTSINYSLKEEVPVLINVYNHTGQLVKTLVNGVQKAGYYSVTWNAAGLASGLYFYKMQAGDYQMIKRAMVIK